MLLEAAFLFALMSNFPGLCTNDSNDIINQVLGVSEYSTWHRYDGLSNHHPVFYTFLVWIVFQATSFLGSMDWSVFCFLFMQMTFVAFGCSWSLAWLNRHRVGKLYMIFAVCFFVLSPVLAGHSIIMWKDVPFSIVILMLVLFLYDASRQSELSKKDVVKLLVILLALVMLRNNGIYVALATLVYAIIVFGSFRKKLIASGIVLVLIAAIVQGPLFALLSVEKGHFSESVSVPLQQVAATVAGGGEVTESQAEFLNQVLPLDEMADTYNPTSPNPLKFSVNFNDEFLEAHKLEFISVWAHMLPSNLGDYVRAWVLLTEGYWNPGFQGSSIGATTAMFEQETNDLLGFGWDPNDLSSALKAGFPALFGMGTFVPTVFCVAVLCLLLNRRRGAARKLTCFLPLAALAFTLLIAAPINNDFRYVLSFCLVLPFLPILATLFGECDSSAQASSRLSVPQTSGAF